MRLCQIRHLLKNNSHPSVEGESLQYCMDFLDRFQMLVTHPSLAGRDQKLGDMLGELAQREAEEPLAPVVDLFSKHRIR